MFRCSKLWAFLQTRHACMDLLLHSTLSNNGRPLSCFSSSLFGSRAHDVTIRVLFKVLATHNFTASQPADNGVSSNTTECSFVSFIGPSLTEGVAGFSLSHGIAVRVVVHHHPGRRCRRHLMVYFVISSKPKRVSNNLTTKVTELTSERKLAMDNNEAERPRNPDPRDGT